MHFNLILDMAPSRVGVIQPQTPHPIQNNKRIINH